MKNSIQTVKITAQTQLNIIAPTGESIQVRAIEGTFKQKFLIETKLRTLRLENCRKENTLENRFNIIVAILLTFGVYGVFVVINNDFTKIKQRTKYYYRFKWTSDINQKLQIIQDYLQLSTLDQSQIVICVHYMENIQSNIIHAKDIEQQQKFLYLLSELINVIAFRQIYYDTYQHRLIGIFCRFIQESRNQQNLDYYQLPQIALKESQCQLKQILLLNLIQNQSKLQTIKQLQIKRIHNTSPRGEDEYSQFKSQLKSDLQDKINSF